MEGGEASRREGAEYGESQQLRCAPLDSMMPIQSLFPLYPPPLIRPPPLLAPFFSPP